jgi:hypothetical protein
VNLAIVPVTHQSPIVQGPALYDFELVLEIAIALDSVFLSATYPSSSLNSRHAFIARAFPADRQREQALASLGPAAAADYDSETNLALFYASLPSAPTSRASRKGKERAGIAGNLDPALVPPGLVPTLMPFQKRSVQWMLAREGMQAMSIGANGVSSVHPLSAPDQAAGRRPLFWERCEVEGSGKWHVNRVTGEVVRDEAEIDQRSTSDYRGGMLCEEMVSVMYCRRSHAVLIRSRASARPSKCSR